MEIQKYLNQAVSKVPAKQELTPLKTFDNAFELARVSASVGFCTNEEMIQALQYCMLLVGIRAANVPEKIEFDFLKEFIRRHFPGHTVAEIKLAFDMAVGGKLDLGPDGAKCYENFSCEYVGRIMGAYRKWAEQVARYNDKKRTTEEKKQPTVVELLEINIDYAVYLAKQARKKTLLKPLTWNLKKGNKKF